MKLVTVARSVASAVGRALRTNTTPEDDVIASESPAAAELGELEELRARTADLKVALAAAEAKADRYFGCIRSFEEQRDEWSALYKRQAFEHAAAQALLERAVAMLTAQRNRAVTILNAERSERGVEKITPQEIVDVPSGTAEKYLRRHIALFEEARARFGLPPLPKDPPGYRPYQCNGHEPDGSPCRGEACLCLAHHDELARKERECAIKEW